MHSTHGSNSDIRWSHQASWDFKPAHALWVDETSNAGSPSEDVQPTKQLDMNCGRKLSKQRVRRASGLHRHCSTCMCHSTVPCLANLILAGLACRVNNSCRSHSCRKDMTRPFTHTHTDTPTPTPTHTHANTLTQSGWACLQQSRKSCSNASPTYKASIDQALRPNLRFGCSIQGSEQC